MKGKLHKSINYGWLIQHEPCGIDNISFYPLHPFDLFTNSIDKYEGKEVKFILLDFWDTEKEQLSKVAIVSANLINIKNTEVIKEYNNLNNMKTTMQKLIDYIEKNETSRTPTQLTSVEIHRKAMELLETEKEEIIGFGNDLIAQYDINYIGIPNLAEQYYNETYKKD